MDANLHLHIAFSDKLMVPFAFHSENPVKISAHSARPAGTSFLNESGELIYPPQNFRRAHAGSVVFKRIITLTRGSCCRSTAFVAMAFKPLRRSAQKKR